THSFFPSRFLRLHPGSSHHPLLSLLPVLRFRRPSLPSSLPRGGAGPLLPTLPPPRRPPALLLGSIHRARIESSASGGEGLDSRRKMASGSSNGEPSTAPQPNRWYDLRLGSSCRDPSPTTKFCTLRYEFKPASIDKTQAGSLQSTKDNRVTVEFQNNQPGKPKVTFEGSQEEYKDNDGVLFFDGETFRLERLHRAVKRLRHVRVPGETATTNLTTTTTGIVTESHSPPFAKVGKSQSISKPPVHSVPVEVERIDIGEPENSGPRYNNKSTTYQPVTTDPFALSPDPVDEDENLDILGDDDDNVSPNNMISGQGTSVRGFDINLPNQGNMDDEIADVDVNDEADEGLNAAEALRAQVNAEGQQEQGSSSSSGTSSSSSSGSGSGSGSSSSDSDGSDGDSASSGADVDI
ncbi:unnamed protein product, partial [Urochloa humidicola]